MAPPSVVTHSSNTLAHMDSVAAKLIQPLLPHYSTLPAHSEGRKSSLDLNPVVTQARLYMIFIQHVFNTFTAKLNNLNTAVKQLSHKIDKLVPMLHNIAFVLHNTCPHNTPGCRALTNLPNPCLKALTQCNHDPVPCYMHIASSHYYQPPMIQIICNMTSQVFAYNFKPPQGKTQPIQ